MLDVDGDTGNLYILGYIKTIFTFDYFDEIYNIFKFCLFHCYVPGSMCNLVMALEP